MKKTTLKTRRQKNEYGKKRWQFSSPEKCVPDHDDRFIHRCRVRLYEDSQLHMLSSIYQLNIRRLYNFFLTHSLMLDSWEKERKRRIVLLRFGFNGEERKKNVFCIILSNRWRILISWRQDHSLEHPVLKNIVASIESPFIRPSSTLRTKTTRRTI